jgi:hypothetical protein
VAKQFLAQVVEQARQKGLTSDYFTVHGTLLEAWASVRIPRFARSSGDGAHTNS